MCGAQGMVHSQKHRQTPVLELERTPAAALPGSSHRTRPPPRPFPPLTHSDEPLIRQRTKLHTVDRVWAFLENVLRLAYRLFFLRENCLPTGPFLQASPAAQPLIPLGSVFFRWYQRGARPPS